MLFVCLGTQAKVRLPGIFSDHMVLQRNTEVKLWGKASPNKTVSIKTSWDNKTYNTESNGNGKWNCQVKTPEAGGPYYIEFSDGETLVLNDILIGEVWLCSGQSNMEMPMRGFKGQPVNQSQEFITSANPNRNIRFCMVKKTYSSSLVDTIGGNWMLHTPETVSRFSATGYFFGNYLQKSLDIPVGLIQAAWNGSSIEAWIDRETLETVRGVSFPDIPDAENKSPNKTPALLYNAMIYPIRNISLRGVIWYQGEGNRSRPGTYEELFTKMVDKWRSLFGNNKLPFYFVQLAPFKVTEKDRFEFPVMHEIQMKCMQKIPHTGMAFTTDVGNENYIHAPKKREVGERLAYWALAKTYGLKGIIYSGPIFDSYEKKNDKVEVTFSHAPLGLIPEKIDLAGFEVLNDKGEILPVRANIIPETPKIRIHTDEIAGKIVEIRYCYRNYIEGNLFNTAGLPAFPFRVKID